MKAKLNLTIEEPLLRRVKEYAAKKHISVSELVEEYFEMLTNPAKKKSIFDFLHEVKSSDFPKDYDFNAGYYFYFDKLKIGEME